MKLVTSNTDGRGHYTLTVERAGTKGAALAVRLTVERKDTTERVIISWADWVQLCKQGPDL